MRLLSAALYTTVAAALLAGCSGNGSSPSSSTPGGSMPQGVSKAGTASRTEPIPKWLAHNRPTHQIKAPASAVRGIATAEFGLDTDNVLVYPKNNSANGPAVCSKSTEDNVNDVGVDSSGNLIVPNAFDGVDVYAPPFTASSCGTLLGTITDSLARPLTPRPSMRSTERSSSATYGGRQRRCTCTLASLSCTTLSTPGYGRARRRCDGQGRQLLRRRFNTAGVALSGYSAARVAPARARPRNWVQRKASGSRSTAVSTLTTGATSSSSRFSTLEDSTPSLITVYSGCTTGTCTIVGGPFTANGTAEYVFGHVGRQNERFVAGNVFTGIDVYAYGRTSVSPTCTASTTVSIARPTSAKPRRTCPTPKDSSSLLTAVTTNEMAGSRRPFLVCRAAGYPQSSPTIVDGLPCQRDVRSRSIQYAFGLLPANFLNARGF